MDTAERSQGLSQAYHWEVDDDGYPTDESLNSLQNYLSESLENSYTAVATWLVKEFPKLAMSIPYGRVEVRKIEDYNSKGEKGSSYYEIEYSTGGWSGQESFIYAVLESPFVKMLYHYAWERGGHYKFRIPVWHVED